MSAESTKRFIVALEQAFPLAKELDIVLCKQQTDEVTATLRLSDLKELLAEIEHTEKLTKANELSARTMLNATLADNLRYRLIFDGILRAMNDGKGTLY